MEENNDEIDIVNTSPKKAADKKSLSKKLEEIEKDDRESEDKKQNNFKTKRDSYKKLIQIKKENAEKVNLGKTIKKTYSSSKMKKDNEAESKNYVDKDVNSQQKSPPSPKAQTKKQKTTTSSPPKTMKKAEKEVTSSPARNTATLSEKVKDKDKLKTSSPVKMQKQPISPKNSQKAPTAAKSSSNQPQKNLENFSSRVTSNSPRDPARASNAKIPSANDNQSKQKEKSKKDLKNAEIATSPKKRATSPQSNNQPLKPEKITEKATKEEKPLNYSPLKKTKDNNPTSLQDKGKRSSSTVNLKSNSPKKSLLRESSSTKVDQPQVISKSKSKPIVVDENKSSQAKLKNETSSKKVKTLDTSPNKGKPPLVESGSSKKIETTKQIKYNYSPSKQNSSSKLKETKDSKQRISSQPKVVSTAKGSSSRNEKNDLLKNLLNKETDPDDIYFDQHKTQHGGRTTTQGSNKELLKTLTNNFFKKGGAPSPIKKTEASNDVYSSPLKNKNSPTKGRASPMEKTTPGEKKCKNSIQGAMEVLIERSEYDNNMNDLIKPHNMNKSKSQYGEDMNLDKNSNSVFIENDKVGNLRYQSSSQLLLNELNKALVDPKNEHKNKEQQELKKQLKKIVGMDDNSNDFGDEDDSIDFRQEQLQPLKLKKFLLKKNYKIKRTRTSNLKKENKYTQKAPISSGEAREKVNVKKDQSRELERVEESARELRHQDEVAREYRKIYNEIESLSPSSKLIKSNSDANFIKRAQDHLIRRLYDGNLRSSSPISDESKLIIENIRSMDGETLEKIKKILKELNDIDELDVASRPSNSKLVNSKVEKLKKILNGRLMELLLREKDFIPLLYSEENNRDALVREKINKLTNKILGLENSRKKDRKELGKQEKESKYKEKLNEYLLDQEERNHFYSEDEKNSVPPLNKISDLKLNDSAINENELNKTSKTVKSAMRIEDRPPFDLNFTNYSKHIRESPGRLNKSNMTLNSSMNKSLDASRMTARELNNSTLKRAKSNSPPRNLKSSTDNLVKNSDTINNLLKKQVGTENTTLPKPKQSKNVKFSGKDSVKTIAIVPSSNTKVTPFTSDNKEMNKKSSSTNNLNKIKSNLNESKVSQSGNDIDKTFTSFFDQDVNGIMFNFSRIINDLVGDYIKLHPEEKILGELGSSPVKFAKKSPEDINRNLTKIEKVLMKKDLNQITTLKKKFDKLLRTFMHKNIELSKDEISVIRKVNEIITERIQILEKAHLNTSNKKSNRNLINVKLDEDYYDSEEYYLAEQARAHEELEHLRKRELIESLRSKEYEESYKSGYYPINEGYGLSPKDRFAATLNNRMSSDNFFKKNNYKPFRYSDEKDLEYLEKLERLRRLENDLERINTRDADNYYRSSDGRGGMQNLSKRTIDEEIRIRENLLNSKLNQLPNKRGDVYSPDTLVLEKNLTKKDVYERKQRNSPSPKRRYFSGSPRKDYMQNVNNEYDYYAHQSQASKYKQKASSSKKINNFDDYIDDIIDPRERDSQDYRHQFNYEGGKNNLVINNDTKKNFYDKYMTSKSPTFGYVNSNSSNKHLDTNAFTFASIKETKHAKPGEYLKESIKNAKDLQNEINLRALYQSSGQSKKASDYQLYPTNKLKKY